MEKEMQKGYEGVLTSEIDSSGSFDGGARDSFDSHTEMKVTPSCVQGARETK